MLAWLLLNRITLAQGQAMYLPAGNLHAYLSGVGVEIMVSSDNVLRRGLTRKHADVDELVEIMDFSAGDIPVLTGQAETTGELTYSAPVPEFRLSRLDLDGEQRNNQPPRAACAAEPPGGGHRHRLHGHTPHHRAGRDSPYGFPPPPGTSG